MSLHVVTLYVSVRWDHVLHLRLVKGLSMTLTCGYRALNTCLWVYFGLTSQGWQVSMLANLTKWKYRPQAWHYWQRNLMGAVLGKAAKFITAITLGIRAVAATVSWSPQTKHLPSQDIILTVEGFSLALSWCAAMSFSTSLMTSARVWGPFHIFWLQ